MKNYILISFMVFLFSFSLLSFSSENNQYQFLELSLNKVQSDESEAESLTGGGISVRYAAFKNIFLSGTFQRFESDDFKFDRYFLGAGGWYAVNEYISIFGKFDYATVKAEIKPFDFSDTANYMRAGGGVNGSYNNIGYELGIIRYFDVGNDDGLESEVVLKPKVFYHINEVYTVGAGVELFDDGSIYQVNGRFHY